MQESSHASPDPPPVIWWIRRDLRLHDNQALNHAVANGSPVIPLFILDPAILESAMHRHAEKRKAFLFGGLQNLDRALRRRGSRLYIRRGEPEAALAGIMAEAKARLICAEEDYSPYARKRDEAVAARLPLRLLPGVSLHHPAGVLKPDGKPYAVFTPFCRAWKMRPMPGPRDILPAPGRIRTPRGLASEPVPALDKHAPFLSGEDEAHRRLQAFAAGPIFEYGDGRDRLDLDGTSFLSPYFRFGMLSVREAATAADTAFAAASRDRRARDGVACWLNELIWREFYMAVLYHFPHVLQTAFRPAFRKIQWRRDAAAMMAWQEGQTGYPVVDAGMRQLGSSGWMHNRARMIVASFLVKDLLIDWRRGERWFMRHLVDGDPAANNGGWQWSAGVGTDAAPYFRIFNPVRQGEKFDPNGDYVRRWVPELAGLPARWIHRPWEASARILADAGVKLGRTYPERIIDHDQARIRALAVLAR